MAEAEKRGGNKEGWKQGRGLQWRAGLAGASQWGERKEMGVASEGGEWAGLAPHERGASWGFWGENGDIGELRGGLGLVGSCEKGEP